MLYYNPKSLDEALELLDSLDPDEAVILAGGTDVVPKINARPERSGYFDKPLMDMEKQKIIYLGDAGLNYIVDRGEEIAIGAMTTITEILESPVIDQIPVLKEALGSMAGVAIRNVATIGGNIMNASPAADSVPALIALQAKAVFASVDGERTSDLYHIFVAPEKTDIREKELLREIRIPMGEGRGKFIKFGRRKAESLSIVNGAAYAEMEGKVCRQVVVALGAVAPTPLKVDIPQLEGREVTPELIEKAAEKAAEEVSPIDDQRASSAYRKQLTRVLVKRALTEVCC